MQPLALVGGSSSGIGLAIARELSEQGYEVIMTSSNQDKLANAAKGIRNSKYFVADFGVLGDVIKLINYVESIRIPDVIILNTGGPKKGTIEELYACDYQYAHNLTFLSHMLIVKAFVNRMDNGRIINVSSKLVKEPKSDMILSESYRAALATALKGISKTGYNCTINTVYTGSVYTNRFVNLNKGEHRIKGITERTPVKYIASPDHYANLVKVMISEDFSYVNGASINFDGGDSVSF